MSAFTYRLRNWLPPTRAPDVIIGGSDDPYLLRWHLIPRNRFFNVYLHHFLRSDDDRALHDHPWVNLSWLLIGDYDEVVPEDPSDQARRDPRYHTTIHRSEGAMVLRGAKAAHRVALKRTPGGREQAVWTLFITGPRVRRWGFWCPNGWRFWEDFDQQGCD